MKSMNLAGGAQGRGNDGFGSSDVMPFEFI